MIHNQAYLDAKQAVWDHETTCSFCNEAGYVNYFACPTRLALKKVESDAISQEQMDEAMALGEELDAAAKREKLEATFE